MTDSGFHGSLPAATPEPATGRDQLTIATVINLHSEYDLLLLCDTEVITMKHAPTTERGVKVWWAHVPRIQKTMTLAVSESRQRGAEKRVNSVAKVDIVDDRRCNYLFLFALEYSDWRMQNSAETADSQLLYFFEHFVQRPNYMAVIPQLILQFNPRNLYNSRQKSHLCKRLDRIVERHRTDLSREFAQCVFAVLGSLVVDNSREEIPRYTSELISRINGEFVTQLRECPNTKFVTAVLRGVEQCLTSEKAVSQKAAICHLLAFEKVPERFLAKVLEIANSLGSRELSVLVGAISRQKNPHSLAKTLLAKVEGYAALFTILRHFDVSLSGKREDTDLLDQIRRRARGEGYFAKRFSCTVEEIEEVLDIVSSNPGKLKALYNYFGLPRIIESLLMNPSPSSFSLYKRLFVTNYDEQLFGEVKKEKFLAKLCSTQGVSFANVANELRPGESYVEALFQKWMLANCARRSSSFWSLYDWNNSIIASNISKIDNEFQQLMDADLAKLLSQKAVELFSQDFPLSSSSLASIAKAIDAVHTEQLKLAYISHNSVLSRLWNKDVTLYDLLREKSSGGESWLIDKLLEYWLGSSKVITYEKVEETLIQLEVIEPIWLVLMKDFRHYKNFEMIAALQESLQRFARKMQARELSISKFLQLSAKTPEQLQTIYKLLSYATEADSQVYETLQKEAVAIAAKISLLQQFSTHIISDPAEHAAALEEIKRARATYQETLLVNFRFTPQQEALYACAKKAALFNGSGLFLARIAQAQRTAPITIATVEAVCVQAIADLSASVSGLLKTLASTKVGSVVEFFAGVEDWRREKDLLERAQPLWSAGLRELGQGLEYYASLPRLTSNFRSLTSMMQFMQQADPEAASTVEIYLNADAKSLNFQELVVRHNQAIRVLYPEGDPGIYEPAFEVLVKLQQESELLSFLPHLSEDRLRHLREGVNDYEEFEITESMISQLENVWWFFTGLREAAKYSQLVKKTWEQMQMPQFDAIRSNISQCAVNIYALMEYAANLEKKEEAKIKQMEACFKSSETTFVKGEKGYAVSVQYSSRKQSSFNLANLQELKDRASLSIYTASQEDDPRLHILRLFVDFVSEANTTAEALLSLQNYGYPVDIAEGKKFRCLDGNFPELKEFQKQATALLQDWQIAVEEAYQRSYHLTFLFGRQFWTVEEHLNGKANNQAAGLLSYMLRRSGGAPQEAETDPEKRLIRLGEMLNELAGVETPQIKHEAPVEERIKSPPGFVLYISVPNDRVLNALVSAYLNSGRAFPQAHQVMNCTRRPQWAELQAFLYRCFTSPQGEMFALIGPERLPLELQTALRSLFAKLVSSGVGKGRFSLVLITSEERSLFADYFQQLEEPKCIKTRSEQIMSDDAALGNFIQKINQSASGRPTVVVRSEVAGEGKSTWVKRQALPVQKFPLTGDLDLEAICAQLMEVVKPDSVLLLTLSHVDAVEVLNDLLISLCLLRTVRAGHLVVVLPATCHVYVEVQNLHPPLQVPFLKYLKQETVKFDINRFTLDEESKVVVAYLQLYKTNAIARGDASTVQVTTEMAVRHLTEYFLTPQMARGQLPSYIALRSFISLVSALLKAMEQSPFSRDMIEYLISDAAAAGVPQLKSEYENLRAHIVESFLKTSEEVTTRCVGNVRKGQEKTVRNEIFEPVIDDTLSWDKSNHFSMIFLQDGSHVAIYRMKESVPLPLKKLIYLQANFSQGGPTLMQQIASNQYQINDYENLSHAQALVFLQTYAKADNELILKHIDGDYVLTQDNFLKMNLIYLRAAARLPIIIVGETGCGKTSLIRFFVQEVLGEILEVVNIHAGVTSEVLALSVRNIRQLAEKNSHSRLWVFFDEFNTSNCVGYISEMLCERTFRGKELPPNLVLLAACNPYRLRPPQLAEVNVGIKKAHRYQTQTQQNLMHVVKPMPEAMVEYIWDFGALVENDRRKYIEAMLKSQGHKSVFASAIIESQKYFHRLEDVSSVSLRDVARFVIFSQWFAESLKLRNTMRDGDRFRKNCERYKLRSDWRVLSDVELCAGVLALCICYYYRLATQEQRLDYLQTICNQSNGALRVDRIEEVLKCNEDDFLARMELPDVTALNQAFRENVSCMIHCFLSKVPLFVCGKPGCSKSLAVQQVLDNLRGTKSVDPYFRTLPELVIVYFQGSESSTSEGIEKTFARAKRFLENKHLLPVVVFDEIGLAELSKNNPLKVLHSLLELENRSVGFVGVSNWRLDASKMNRAVYLARPDPDLRQLIFTARSILAACKKQEPTNAEYSHVEAMTTAYFKFKQELKETSNEDFFGLRDFYSMIKHASFELISHCLLDLEQIFNIIKVSVERNFGGKVGASARMLAHIIRIRPEFLHFSHLPPTRPIDLINSNLKDAKSRFLMVICKGDVAAYALDRYIVLPDAERRTLVGSHMREDEGAEEYSFRSLSEMILYMEKGFCVILKDMDHIYTSLYDLFNQNYSVAGDRRYCRVALGAQFNPRCFVHDNFRVIVFLRDDEDVLKRIDAPFLNRFEKHIFDIDQASKQDDREAFGHLQHWTNSLTTLATGDELQISLNHAIPLHSEEYLKLLLLNQNTNVVGLTVKKCKNELLKMASQDILLLVHAGVMEPEEKAYIQETWKSYHNESLLGYLSTFSLSKESKSLVFLYNTDILKNEQLSQVSVPTYYQHFSAFRKEQEIVEDIAKFYRGPNQLYILDFNLAKDGAHLVMVKFIVETIAKELKNPQKKVCLLVRLMRNVPIDIEVCWFDQWDMRTFTSISAPDLMYTYEVARQSIEAIALKRSFYDAEAGLGKLILDAYQTIAFRLSKSEGHQEDINNHIFHIAEQVTKSPALMKSLLAKLASLLPKKHWLDEVLCRRECVARAPNIPAAISCAVELGLASVLPGVIYEIEKFGAFRSFFQQKSEECEFLQQLGREVLETLECSAHLQLLKQSNRLDFTLHLKFPFIWKDYDMINEVYKECQALLSDEAKTHFLRKYSERSILKRHFEEINKSRLLCGLYLQDLIHIDLIEHPNNHIKDFLAVLQNCWTIDPPTIKEKVWAYVQNRNFSLALCEIVEVLQDLKVEGVGAIYEQLNKFVWERQSAKDGKSTAEKVRSILHNGLTTIIARINNNSGWLNNAEAALLLTRLATCTNCLKSLHNFSVENSDEVEILTICFQALTGAGDSLRRLQQSAAGVTNGPFLYNEDFSQQLTSTIQRCCPAHVAQHVLSVYLPKLLKWDSLKYLPLVVAQVDDDRSTLWKQSSPLMAEVLNAAKLTPEKWAVVMKTQKSPVTDLLERLLSKGNLDTKFSVLMCDSVYRYLKKRLSYTSAEDAEAVVSAHYGNFNQFYRVVGDPGAEFPSIRKIYSSAFLRCYLEAYYEAMHGGISLSPDSAVWRVTDELDSGSFPTARAYVLKHSEEEKVSGATALSVVNETTLQAQLPHFPLLPLFRLTQTPDVLSLSAALELQQMHYPLLSLYLQNREEIAVLSLLTPLIEFTNYLRDSFDFRISREEAGSRRLIDVFQHSAAAPNRPDLKARELFEKCAGVWSWLAKTPVSYENQHFPPKQFSSGDELRHFLVDKQANGGMHITAALLKLADIQNSALHRYLAIMKEKQNLPTERIMDERKVPIQQLQPDNVLHFSLESVQDFEGSFVNNPAYGEEKEVIYDFQRIEDKIQLRFAQGRFISGDVLDFICYTFEMLSTTSQHSDLITDIRSLVPQKPFDTVQIAIIERFLAMAEGGTAELHQQELTAYYQSLNSMCCFLRNAPVQADLTLLEFAHRVNKFNVCEAFMQPTPLSQVRTEHIVALYELLECALFPYVKPVVKREFTRQTTEVSDSLNGLSFSGIRPLDELQLAVMRLILRLLRAEIDPTQMMGLYVTRPDLWAQDCSEEQIARFGAQLGQVPLAHAMQVYDFLELRVRESLEVTKNILPSKTTKRTKRWGDR